jgi:hypothetical protein
MRFIQVLEERQRCGANRRQQKQYNRGRRHFLRNSAAKISIIGPRPQPLTRQNDAKFKKKATGSPMASLSWFG